MTRACRWRPRAPRSGRGRGRASPPPFGLPGCSALGRFDHGKRGILDLTHHRLFTNYSFKKLLANGGFIVGDLQSFGPPIHDMVGSSGALRGLDTVAARLATHLPRLFAFNFPVSAKKAEELDDIDARTADSARSVGSDTLAS